MIVIVHQTRRGKLSRTAFHFLHEQSIPSLSFSLLLVPAWLFGEGACQPTHDDELVMICVHAMVPQAPCTALPSLATGTFRLANAHRSQCVSSTTQAGAAASRIELLCIPCLNVWSRARRSAPVQTSMNVGRPRVSAAAPRCLQEQMPSLQIDMQRAELVWARVHSGVGSDTEKRS